MGIPTRTGRLASVAGILLLSGLVSLEVNRWLGPGDPHAGTGETQIQIPATGEGDHVRYWVEAPPGTHGISGDGAYVEFSTLPSLTTPDANGRFVRAHRFFLQAPASIAGQEERMEGRTLWIDAGTGMTFAVSDVRWDTHRVTRGDSALRADGSRMVERRTFLTSHDESAAARPPCGLDPRVLARDLPLDRPFQIFSGCRLPAGPPGLEVASNTNFLATARGTMAERPVVRFEAQDLPGPHLTGLHVWYEPGIPYPLGFAVFMNGTRDPAFRVLLTTFEPGEPALTTATGADPGQAPTVRLAPRRPWGPEDAGVDHPFPLSRAFAFVQKETTDLALRRFWLDHPGAEVAAAEYSELRSAGGAIYQWRLLLVHQRHELAVCPYKEVHPLGLPAAGPRLGGQAAGYGLTNPCASFGSEARPGATGLPSLLPTIESLSERARAYFPVGTPPEASWGFAWICRDDRCARPSLDVWIGGVLDEVTTGGTRRGPSLVATREVRAVHFDADGNAVEIVDRTERIESGAEGAPRLSRRPFGPALDSNSSPPWSFAPTVLLVAGGVSVASAAWVFSRGFLGWMAENRLDEARVRNNHWRSRILDLVAARPGIHFADIVRETGLGHGATEHHLTVLARAGLIASVRGTRYRCYFPGKGSDRREMAAAPILKAAGAVRLLGEVRRSPGRSLTDLARTLDLSVSAVHYHAHRLASASLVRLERQGTVVRVLTPVA